MKKLEIYTFAVSVLGIVVTLFFSVITMRLGQTANDLAQKSVILAENDSLSRDQIEKLRTVILGQNEQLSELKDIQSNTKNQIFFLTKQLGQLSAQNTLLSQQTQEVTRQSNAVVSSVNSTYSASFQTLKEAFEKSQKCLKGIGRDSLFRLPLREKADCMLCISETLSGQTSNQYLHSQPTLLAKWRYFASQTCKAGEFIEDWCLSGNNISVKDGINPPRIATLEEIVTSCNQDFKDFYDKNNNFYWETWNALNVYSPSTFNPISEGNK